MATMAGVMFVNLQDADKTNALTIWWNDGTRTEDSEGAYIKGNFDTPKSFGQETTPPPAGLQSINP